MYLLVSKRVVMFGRFSIFIFNNRIFVQSAQALHLILHFSMIFQALLKLIFNLSTFERFQAPAGYPV